ncbi:MAG: peptide deformylase [Candidatus Marinimicrobia bacterium]|nr:peptide deformylase [Candidatus Neomarinimicrobiota bacterium]
MKKLILFSFIAIFLYNCTQKSQNFSSEQTQIISSGDTLEPMRVFTIANRSDSLLLRSISKNIVPEEDDKILHILIKRMYATVQDSASKGVGIAAPQIGILKNLIWVQRFDKEGEPFEYYLNPQITQYSDLKQDCREGCLSVPVIKDTTHTRSYTILLEYDKIDKSHHIEMIEGFTAVIFQHEIDHLNGILFLDKLEE